MQVYKLQLSENAIHDASEISLWYEKQLKGLGDRFLNEFYFALTRIASNPFAFSRIHKQSDIRKYYIRRFHYNIYFNTAIDPVLVLAVIHTARSKRYIRKRLL